MLLALDGVCFVNVYGCSLKVLDVAFIDDHVSDGLFVISCYFSHFDRVPGCAREQQTYKYGTISRFILFYPRHFSYDALLHLQVWFVPIT